MTQPRFLILAGSLAGPLLVGSSLVQGATREGFDFEQHPPSALALGSAGYVQQVTFIVAGLLLVVGAMGMHRANIGRWAPALTAALGAALSTAGVFRMDPAFGFPPGTPSGVGDSVSWHAAVHGVLFPVGFAALVGTALVMARRYGLANRRTMQGTAIAVAVVSLLLSMWPNLAAEPDGRFLPMWIGVTVGYLWMALMQFDLARQARGPSTATRERHGPLTQQRGEHG